MRPRLSPPATCAMSEPNETRRRVTVALTVLATTYFGFLLWQATVRALGDGLIAAMLVALLGVTLLAPVAKLLRT